MMFQTPEYASRARTVAHVLGKDKILNVCGEWNAHSNALPHVRARFNQTLFGAAYGASVLLHLIRGSSDAEMLWTGTDDACGYGVMDKDARPTPLFYAKALCAQYIRFGDRISFPIIEQSHADLDIVVGRGDDGRRSALLVHLKDEMATYAVPELTGDAGDYRTVLKIDAGTGNQVIEMTYDSTVSFNGYGVAVLTNAVAGRDTRGQLT